MWMDIKGKLVLKKSNVRGMKQLVCVFMILVLLVINLFLEMKREIKEERKERKGKE